MKVRPRLRNTLTWDKITRVNCLNSFHDLKVDLSDFFYKLNELECKRLNIGQKLWAYTETCICPHLIIKGRINAYYLVTIAGFSGDQIALSNHGTIMDYKVENLRLMRDSEVLLDMIHCDYRLVANNESKCFGSMKEIEKELKDLKELQDLKKAEDLKNLDAAWSRLSIWSGPKRKLRTG